MPSVSGPKLYLAAFTLAVWMAFFSLPGPFSQEIVDYLKFALPIAGTAPLPFLGVELTTMLKDFAEKLSGKQPPSA